MREIVVTGGGTGIGYAVAAGFVRAGERVTITGRREHVLKEAVASLGSVAGSGAPAAGYACFDAADPDAVGDALPRQARKDRLIAETRNGRPGTTVDVAAVVTFLASPDAGHLTGQVIHVNGGAYPGR